MESSIWTADQEAAALERVRQFEGTRHMHRRAIPGIGIDCINLVITALKAGGMLEEEFVIPAYKRNIGLTKTHNTIEDRFLENFHCVKIERPAPEDLQPGDGIVFEIHRSVNHVGIYLGGEIWHSLWSCGVLAETPGNMSLGIQSAMRFTRPGLKAPMNEI